MSREAPPPSYDKVTEEAPPNPAPGPDSRHGNTNNNDGLLHPGGADLARTSSASSDTGGNPFEGLSPEEQREFADEYRDLPEGWVKCWDPKNKHHFYVEEATERSIWVHPYDDPDYLSTLPDTHPANPESQAARERRQELEKASEQAARRANRDRVGGSDLSGTDTDEEGPGMSSRAAMMQDSEHGDKSWFQRQKDKLADKKERRAKRKAEERKQRAEQEKQIRAQVEAYRKKREELIRGQYAAMGSSSSSRYAAPSMAYRSPLGLGPSYGYGYGGYGRPMGMGYGGYGGYGYGRPMGMGMGMPLGLGMMGGLGTGMLLGGAMGGGFGGGYGGGDFGGGGGGDGGGGGC